MTGFARFRHSGWHRRRRITRDALRRAGATEKSVARFEQCGTHASVWYSKTLDQLALHGSFCRNRACVPCSAARAAIVSRNLARHIEHRHTRFLTLTLRHRDIPLPKLLTRLWRCFKELRSRSAWKQRVLGFAAFLECKHSPRTSHWHAHLHVLVEGSYWAQRELSQEWLTVTGDSPIVDIREVKDHQHGAAYVAKYVTKPWDADIIARPDIFTEALACFARRRLFLVGGTWRGLRLNAKPPTVTDWEFVATTRTLFHLAFERSDSTARVLLTMILGYELPELDIRDTS